MLSHLSSSNPREGVAARARSEPVNAFTVDVEDYFHVAALSSAISRDSWPTRESRVERNTERLLSLLAERDLHGTFFILGWVAERSPTLVRRISESGHEVACHGFSHQLIYRQSAATFREETRRAKGFLEDIVGRPVLGYRAASFSITRESLWALDVLIECGFEYDSSIFPVRHDRYGIPGASPSPGRIPAPSGRTIVEFPMSVASVLGLRVPVSGGGYFRLLPYGLTRAGLRKINESARRPFVFYLHPWEIDPDQPRFRVSPLSRFRHYTNLERCEDRLKLLLQDFAFAPAIQVLRRHGVLGLPQAPTTDAMAAAYP
ncbi:MAG: XrtA system polysaccharide deacetylase [Steroidobacteraceae bacterium]